MEKIPTEFEIEIMKQAKLPLGEELRPSASNFAGPFSRIANEFRFFKTMPHDMRVLLVTNLIYAFVIPVIEIFVGAYIMRNSNDPKIVALYQLTVYAGIPLTFFENGFLLSRVKISTLYSFGVVLSGLSMLVMMTLDTLSIAGVGIAGILIGCSFGFFWANRDYLALETTTDKTRNYY